jgi:two-component system cell cycle sensor histidine kinase/response regulator CckA
MGQSGITERINPQALTRRILARLGLPRRPPAIAAEVRGPLLGLAIIVLSDVLARAGAPVPSPFPFLILSVVYAAMSGGGRPAAVSAMLTIVYAGHYFSQVPGHLRYDHEGVEQLLSVVAASCVAGFVASRARSRYIVRSSRELTTEEANAVRRRLSLLEQTSAVLASSLEYESTLQGVARLLASTHADWTTFHLANAAGEFRFVAGAHRDPGRDLLVRALCEYGARGLTFGAPGRSADAIAVTDQTLRTRADDAEHLKLYRALRPRAAVRVPIPVGGRTAGVLTMVMAESERAAGKDEVELGEEVAARVTLAIENAMLHREASEADARFRLLFDANPQPMWIFDVETLGFLAVNDAAVRQYGYSRDELMAMTIMDLVPSHESALAPVSVDRGGEQRAGVALARHERKDGIIVEMELISQELDFDGHRARLVVATDVSERTRALAALHQSEEQLRHAQRMDAVGRIGIGVAHDFNNVLTSILGYGDVLLQRLPADDTARDDVERILQTAERGALLTRQLLAFGARKPLAPRRININALVLGMEGLIRRLAGDDIEVHMHLAEGLGTVRVDPVRLEQAVVGLILAAREAMPSGGTMSIETSERYVGGFPTGRLLPPGQYTVLAVGDTGSGVDADDRPVDRRAKEGLGLRVVNAIVRQSGGLVRVMSEPGEGRTVKVYLPVAVVSDEEPVSLSLHSGGRETVLVVEDQDEIRELMRRVLEEGGYEVLAARHGREALTSADRHSGPIDLLVTDVVMPGMSGADVAGELSKARPGLSILYISGYADKEVASRGVRREVDSYLPKPFTGEDLLDKARVLLGKRLA